jgi:hypothetical protein
MGPAFLILMAIAMALTVGVLFTGVFSMARGGEFNRKYANKLMRYRLVFQGIAILFFMLAVLALKD